jgi:hypothetical protein
MRQNKNMNLSKSKLAYSIARIFTIVTVVCLVVPFVQAAETSKLSKKPIPLATEAYALISVEDITDYDALAKNIVAGEANENSPAGRIWQMLSPKLRGELKAAAGSEMSETQHYDLVNGLNAVLRRKGIYTAEAFSSVAIPEELKAALESDLEGLTPVEATSKNRELFQLSFPDQVLVSQGLPFPKRPKTLHIGNDFLNRGQLSEGTKIFTGAVWQPSLLVFGSMRTAYQYVDTGAVGSNSTASEWANRLDLNFNLALTPTERIVVGIRPLDKNGRYSGYQWEGFDGSNSDGNLYDDGNIETLYFEGDFGELFPTLDKHDSKGLDFGFAVGRQPIVIQEGIMINDNIDALGITRNNILIQGTSNVRVTALWAWDDIERGIGFDSDLRPDSAHLYGLFTSIDTHKYTIDLDIGHISARVRDETIGLATRREGGDQTNIGLSIVRRIGHYNTSFRINHSVGHDSGSTSHADDGTVVLGELSWTLPYGEDLVYINGFYGEGNYRSLARDPEAGGPLGRVGLLFASPGIGTVPAPIENTVGDSVGGVIGFQKLFSGIRKQITFEIGGREDTDNSDFSRIGTMISYQQAIKNRAIWRLGTFYVDGDFIDDRVGVRTEFVVRF